MIAGTSDSATRDQLIGGTLVALGTVFGLLGVKHAWWAVKFAAARGVLERVLTIHEQSHAVGQFFAAGLTILLALWLWQRGLAFLFRDHHSRQEHFESQ